MIEKGVRIRKTGRGSLVLLHGAGGNHTIWFPLTRQAWPLDLVLVDLPGHGRLKTQAPLERPEDVLRWLEGTLRELPPPRVVVGHSLGGALGLALAARKGMVDAVGMVASALRFPGRETPGPPEVACRRLFHRPEFRKKCEEHFDRFLDPKTVEADLRLAAALDLRDEAPNIRLPVLFLWARNDALLPYSLALEARALLPHVRYTEIPGGHMVVLENPGGVAEALQAFLETMV